MLWFGPVALPPADWNFRKITFRPESSCSRLIAADPDALTIERLKALLADPEEKLAKLK
jgi:hypothetical protein